MKNLLLTLGLLLSFSAFSIKLDKSQSQIEWLGTKVTGKHNGTVPIKTADLKFKDGEIQNGVIVANLSDIKVTDMSGEWAKKFLVHIQGPDFFEIKKYPTAQFKINKVESGYFYGNLTIKGKTHAEKVKYIKIKNTYEGSLVFDRTKYDMIYGSGSFIKGLGDKAIHDDVQLKFKLVLK
jgi:polyisoprenoid-binding protein YceI